MPLEYFEDSVWKTLSTSASDITLTGAVTGSGDGSGNIPTVLNSIQDMVSQTLTFNWGVLLENTYQPLIPTGIIHYL
jgi:hypothetical protein